MLTRTFIARHPQQRRMSIELWNSRPRISPADQLLALSTECTKLNIQACDMYGDFDATPEQSYLRRFEAEIAGTFEKEDVSVVLVEFNIWGVVNFLALVL